jgi:PHP family Zn ribbon phosphoesterase
LNSKHSNTGGELVSIAQKLIEELESDEKVRRRLSRLLASDIALDTEARVTLVSAIVREVATKSDIEALRKEFKSEMEALKAATKSDIESLRRDVKSDIEALKMATKSDMEALRKEFKSEMEALKAATKSDIESLRKEVKSDIEGLRKEFKSDIEALRGEFREDIGRLDGRISSLEQRVGALEQRVARLEGSINLFMKLFVAFNLPLLVSVVAALVTLLLRAP